MITPLGGSSNLPLGLNGQPGPPPQLEAELTVLSPGATPTLGFVENDPGSAGVASNYTLNVGLPAGTVGPTGPAGHILGSSDFANSPAVGEVPVYGTGPSGPQLTWSLLYPPVPLYVSPASTFAILTETSATPTAIVVTVTIPAQTFRYRPRVSGCVEVTGAVGMRLDAQVMMGLSTATSSDIASGAAGSQVACGYGREDANPVDLAIAPAYAAAMAPTDTSPALAVAAGTAMKFVLSIVRAYGSAAWSSSQTRGELRIALDAV